MSSQLCMACSVKHFRGQVISFFFLLFFFFYIYCLTGDGQNQNDGNKEQMLRPLAFKMTQQLIVSLVKSGYITSWPFFFFKALIKKKNRLKYSMYKILLEVQQPILATKPQNVTSL